MDPRIVKSLIHILKHMNRPVRVPELARLAGLSESHFSREFLYAVGCSPHRFIKEMRLLRAKQLVESTNLSLKAIAASFGTDSSHFNREFSRAHDKAPQQLRRNLRSAMEISQFKEPHGTPKTEGLLSYCCAVCAGERV